MAPARTRSRLSAVRGRAGVVATRALLSCAIPSILRCTVPGSGAREGHARDPGEALEERVLGVLVASQGVRGLDLEALDVLARDERPRVLGRREPHLCRGALVHLVPRVR